MRVLFFFTLLLLTAGCAAKPTHYYINNSARDFQMDQRYCQGVAAVHSPIPRPRVMLGDITDSSSFTSMQNFFGGGEVFAASNRQAKIADACMAQLGWRQVSKAEYDSVMAAKSQPVPPQIVFTADRQGAYIYSRSLDKADFTKLSHKTPTTLNGGAGTSYWQPECYKAVLNGIESETVCRDQQEAIRSVHFVWK